MTSASRSTRAATWPSARTARSSPTADSRRAGADERRDHRGIVGGQPFEQRRRLVKPPDQVVARRTRHPNHRPIPSRHGLPQCPAVHPIAARACSALIVIKGTAGHRPRLACRSPRLVSLPAVRRGSPSRSAAAYRGRPQGPSCPPGALRRAPWRAPGCPAWACRPPCVMTSPARSPALSAGPPLVTATMPVPSGAPSWPVTVPTWAPIAARCELVTCARADELPGDVAGQVGRDGEADALHRGAALRARRGQRRDADDVAGDRHQGAAAVARVDRRAGLDRVGQGGARPAVAARGFRRPPGRSPR